MSDDNNSKSRSSFFSLGGSGLVGSIWAYVATPTSAAFTGWAAVGKSLLVGFGTSVGSTVVGLPLALGGALVGGVAGLALSGGRKIPAIAGAAIVGGAAGLGGVIYGGIEGYQVAERWVIQANAVKTSFNANAAPQLIIQPETTPAAKPEPKPEAPKPPVGP